MGLVLTWKDLCTLISNCLMYMFVYIDSPNGSSGRDVHALLFPFYVIFFVGAGSSTSGNSEESRRPTRKSTKKEELFRIAYMDCPRVGTRKSLIDRLGRTLKTRSSFILHTVIVHAWELRRVLSTNSEEP